jgi:predicted TIM-barrel fold metal-dependent hydrolase
MPSAFASDPVETFRRHIWVAPFYEDDMGALKEALGIDRLLFGSDWPHAEGLTEPTDFALDLRRHHFTEGEIRQVMADNGRSLTLRAA